MDWIRSLYEQIPAEVRAALSEFLHRRIAGPFVNWHLFALIGVLWVVYRWQLSRPHQIGGRTRR